MRRALDQEGPCCRRCGAEGAFLDEYCDPCAVGWDVIGALARDVDERISDWGVSAGTAASFLARLDQPEQAEQIRAIAEQPDEVVDA